MRPNGVVPGVLAALLMAGAHLAAQAQSQPELAQAILEGDARSRGQAVRSVLELAPGEVTGDLRAAVERAVDSELAVYGTRVRAALRGEAVESAGEYLDLGLVEALVHVRGPSSVRSLAGALGTGRPVVDALVDYGEEAIPAILEKITSTDTYPSLTVSGLIALRLILEIEGRDALSEARLEGLRAVANARLHGHQSPIVLWAAIDLAVVLDDPALVAVVEVLASDPEEVRSRGVEDPYFVERTRRHAAERLASPYPLPRPR